MTVCSHCKQPKPDTAFGRDSRRPSGLQCWCRQCAAQAKRQWRVDNPERRKDTERRYEARNPNRHLRNRYGISLDTKRRLFERQGSRCGACGTTEPRHPRLSGESGWCLDHDHATGAIRGVLCWRCNVALGYLDDSPERLRRMADYLENAARNTLNAALGMSVKSGREAASGIAQ